MIMVDWSIGAGALYVVAMANNIRTGEQVAKFVTWLNSATGASLDNYHMIGHSLGGHQVGIIGRNLGGEVAYITALDPAMPGWIINPSGFKPTDGKYTEAIHTDLGFAGRVRPVADVDFYPNQGFNMPGCETKHCSHHKYIFYMAESLMSGGFTGQRCDSLWQALTRNCASSDSLPMGGTTGKPGATGIYYLTTNPLPPYSQALPYDPVIRKLDDGQRYQYMEGPDGALHLVDLWGKVSDVTAAARYDPDRQNVYHLYTRNNPTVSQPLLIGSEGLLGITNYNPSRRTVVLIHGWLDSVTADFNSVLVPAFLQAEDVNVIVVDWSAGAGTINYFTAVENTFTSGLDPAFPGWNTNDNRFRPSDGAYTEVIHTNVGVLGYMATLADVDFYPNGGSGMPGCNSNDCDHARCYHYMAESLTRGGFTGRRCLSYVSAMAGNCNMLGSLRMGGLVPKTGQSGIFHLETNSSPPFSRG
ncbi:hypothetical protein SFRURICE_013327 [Spodoptera frugiperda]|nr:hypothetical protein SFRURICE_013327 [Spodoptera frugiperda]